jgi:hypothetical protein
MGQAHLAEFGTLAGGELMELRERGRSTRR